MKWLFWLAAAGLMGGCAFVEESVDIKYKPEQATAIAPLENAGVVVEVRSLDARIQHRDRVATKKNGYGVELARIKSTRNPFEIVRSAVEQQLKSCGATVAPGGAVITTELLTFYSDFKPAFLIPTADSASEVSFNLKVEASDGGSIYNRTYRGLGSAQDVLVMTPGGSRVSLEQALREAIRDVAQDQTLMSALIGKGKATPGSAPRAASPTPAVPPPVVAPSTVSSSPPPSSTPAPFTPAPVVPTSGSSRSRL